MTGPVRNKLLNMGLKPVKGLADAVDPQDAVNKGQLDAAATDLQDAIDAIDAVITAPVADGTIQSNISGGSAVPSANSISAVLDHLLGTTQGSVVYRGSSAWGALPPGTSGQFLKTNGAGADPAWADVTQSWTTAFKSSDQSVSSSTTLTDCTGLSVSLAANTKYMIRVTMIIITSPSGGLRLATTGPSGSTRARSGFGYSSGFNGVATVDIVGIQRLNNYGTIYNAVTTVTNRVYHFICYVENGSTAGDFKVQFAQSTSNATATTVEAGSFLEYTIVP